MVSHSTLYCGWYSTFILYLALVDCHSVITLSPGMLSASTLPYFTWFFECTVSYMYVHTCIYLVRRQKKDLGDSQFP